MARRCRGFTLVEVLVALSIMAVLAGMAWRGVDGIVRARDISQAQTERSLRLGTVMAQWEQDLAAVHDTGLVKALDFDGATLRIVRGTGAGVQLVAWSLQGGQWRRWASASATRTTELIDAVQRSRQLLGNEPGQVLLLEGVNEVQMYKFIGNSWTNMQSSGDVTPVAGAAPQREQLPAGVRLVLTLGEQRLVRDIVLAQAP